MATVKATLARLVDNPRGDLLLSQVIADFERRDWPVEAEPTRAQLYGVQDLLAPPDDSPDWIELTPGLGGQARQLLRNAYDRAVTAG